MVEQFGQYWLDEKIGEGDMGTVFKASHHSTSDPVALKALNKVDTSSDMKRGTAVEVMQVAATLHHPRLHPITDVVEIQTDEGLGHLALVMPLAGRRSLADVLSSGRRIPEKVALKIVAQIASALQFLHEQEIGHGSLKPSNVLLDMEGNATVTDLSMSTLRELGFVPDEPTRQHMLFNQPEREYHAPATLEGDIFSLGVITYLLLTGQMPWTEAVPEARGIVPAADLSPEVAAVLRKELNPRPRFRYHDLGAFMLALKEARMGKIDSETERMFAPDVPEPIDDEEA